MLLIGLFFFSLLLFMCFGENYFLSKSIFFIVGLTLKIVFELSICYFSIFFSLCLLFPLSSAPFHKFALGLCPLWFAAVFCCAKAAMGFTTVILKPQEFVRAAPALESEGRQLSWRHWVHEAPAVLRSTVAVRWLDQPSQLRIPKCHPIISN